MKAQITALLAGRPGLLGPYTPFDTSSDVQKRKNHQANCVHKPIIVREYVGHGSAYVGDEKNASGSSLLTGVE